MLQHIDTVSLVDDETGPETIVLAVVAQPLGYLMGLRPTLLPGRDLRHDAPDLRDKIAAALGMARSTVNPHPWDDVLKDVAALERMGRL